MLEQSEHGVDLRVGPHGRQLQGPAVASVQAPLMTLGRAAQESDPQQVVIGGVMAGLPDPQTLNQASVHTKGVVASRLEVDVPPELVPGVEVAIRTSLSKVMEKVTHAEGGQRSCNGAAASDS